MEERMKLLFKEAYEYFVIDREEHELFSHMENYVEKLETKIETVEVQRQAHYERSNKLQAKINNIQELLDLTPEDIRDIATYTYEELSHILNWEEV